MLLYDVDNHDTEELNHNWHFYKMLISVIPRSLTIIHLLYDADTHDF